MLSNCSSPKKGGRHGNRESALECLQSLILFWNLVPVGCLNTLCNVQASNRASRPCSYTSRDGGNRSPFLLPLPHPSSLLEHGTLWLPSLELKQPTPGVLPLPNSDAWGCQNLSGCTCPRATLTRTGGNVRFPQRSVPEDVSLQKVLSSSSEQET